MIITAKYLGPTNTKGKRIKVSSYEHGTKYYPYDHALGYASYEQSIRQYITDHNIPEKSGFMLAQTLSGVLAIRSNWELEL
jgi:hypothetical protein